MCCSWLKVRCLHIKKPLATSVLLGSLFTRSLCHSSARLPNSRAEIDYLNFFHISCSCSFSNFISRSRCYHFRGLLGVLNVLQSCCIFSGEVLALKECIFRCHELHGIWSHGGPGLSSSPFLFSVKVRWSLETLRTWMFCLNVGSSIYWCLYGGHPEMGCEVNGCFWYGNWAVSWSCNDA